MSKTTVIKIGKYTYESNRGDVPIPDIYIERHTIFASRIIKMTAKDFTAFFDAKKPFFCRAKIYPDSEYLPLTYSNNPFILTPTEKP